MMSKRTTIGLIVGSIIIAIGLYALVTSFGIQTVSSSETLATGDSTTFQFSAPAHSKQFLSVNGSNFEVGLSSPRGGLQVPAGTVHKTPDTPVTFEWVHLIDGHSKIDLKNIGDSELTLSYDFEVLTDPIQITYHIIVIIGGIVILGFSAGFSIRKPKGF